MNASKPHDIRLGWNFRLRIERDFATRSCGWKSAEFGLFRLRDFPKPGEHITRKNYRGFWFRFAFWLPFENDR